MTFKSVLEWLSQNQVAITVIAAAVGALATAVSAVATVVVMYANLKYARLTKALLEENRILRKAGTEPEVVAYLQPVPGSFSDLHFVLNNVGQGPARNVAFTLQNLDQESFARHNVQFRNSPARKPIDMLPQGERVSYYFSPLHPSLFDEPRLKPFSVLLTYGNLRGEKYQSTFDLDISQFEGFALKRDPGDRMADDLNELTGIFRQLTMRDTYGNDGLRVRLSTPRRLPTGQAAASTPQPPRTPDTNPGSGSSGQPAGSHDPAPLPERD